MIVSKITPRDHTCTRKQKAMVLSLAFACISKDRGTMVDCRHDGLNLVLMLIGKVSADSDSFPGCGFLKTINAKERRK